MPINHERAGTISQAGGSAAQPRGHRWPGPALTSAAVAPCCCLAGAAAATRLYGGAAAALFLLLAAHHSPALLGEPQQRSRGASPCSTCELRDDKQQQARAVSCLRKPLGGGKRIKKKNTKPILNNGLRQLSALTPAARVMASGTGITAGSICHCSQVCCSSEPRKPPAGIVFLQLKENHHLSPTAGFRPRRRTEPTHSQDRGCFFCAKHCKIPSPHVCISQAPRAAPAPLMGQPVTLLPQGSRHSRAPAQHHDSEKPLTQQDTMADKRCRLARQDS